MEQPGVRLGMHLRGEMQSSTKSSSSSSNRHALSYLNSSMEDSGPPDWMASSHSSSGSRQNSDNESRPTFFIPGINGKARCLLGKDQNSSQQHQQHQQQQQQQQQLSVSQHQPQHPSPQQQQQQQPRQPRRAKSLQTALMLDESESTAATSNSNSDKGTRRKKKKSTTTTSSSDRRRKSKKRERMMKRFHEAQASKRSMDDTDVDIALEVCNRRQSFLHERSRTLSTTTAGTTAAAASRSSPILTAHSTNDHLLDVQDIGYQSEEVMGTLIERSSPPCAPGKRHLQHRPFQQEHLLLQDQQHPHNQQPPVHNSLRFLHRRDALPKIEKEDDGSLSLTQNLHNSILRRYEDVQPRTPGLGSVPMPPNHYQSSSSSSPSSNPSFGEFSPKTSSHHDKDLLSPRGHKSMASLLYDNSSNHSRSKNRCIFGSTASSPGSSLDPEDMFGFTSLSNEDIQMMNITSATTSTSTNTSSNTSTTTTTTTTNKGPMERLYTSMSNMLGKPDWAQEDDHELLDKLHQSAPVRERQKLNKCTAELPPLPLLTINNKPEEEEQHNEEKKTRVRRSRRKVDKKERSSSQHRRRRPSSSHNGSGGGGGSEDRSSHRRQHHGNKRRGSVDHDTATTTDQLQDNVSEDRSARASRKNSLLDALQDEYQQQQRPHHHRRKSSLSNSLSTDHYSADVSEERTTRSERRKKSSSRCGEDPPGDKARTRRKSLSVSELAIPEDAQPSRTNSSNNKNTSSLSALDDLPDRPHRHAKKNSHSASNIDHSGNSAHRRSHQRRSKPSKSTEH